MCKSLLCLAALLSALLLATSGWGAAPIAASESPTDQHIPISGKCIDCHADDEPHDGEYGQNCASCHQTKSWEKEDFDHGQTRFPLIGLHTEVSCDSCHDQIEADGSPVSCKNCHVDDEPHDGEYSQNCASCHQPTGWEEEDFDHDLSRFPLIGLHAEVSCDSCHDQIETDSSPVTCKNCHSSDDPHDQKRGPNCARCHNPNGWDLWQFDHLLETGFALEGVHQDLECLACHKESIQDIRISKNCFACHSKDDDHQGRFGRNCDRCHQPTSFKDVRISN